MYYVCSDNTTVLSNKILLHTIKYK